MSVTAWIVTGVLAVAALTATTVLARRNRTNPRQRAGSARIEDRPDTPRPSVARELIEVMEQAAVVLDSGDQVVLANGRSMAMGIVREGRVQVRELLEISREVRRRGPITDEFMLPARYGTPHGGLVFSVQGVQLQTDGQVALVLTDVTEAHRVEAVRRDFVANVSHELKTPIGAINLLGEAIADASDDEQAVRRFAKSMRKEAIRLSILINELIDLSRLQGAEASPPQSEFELGDVMSEAVDRNQAIAEAKNIRIICAGEDGVRIRAVEEHISTAISNLLANAVNYSPENTSVALAYRSNDGFAEIVVKDQGIGIPAVELDRIFERFYRVDRARSRATGGTGLGLAIVKHIATNHGGSVDVWSSEGEGSTFTLRLPVIATVLKASTHTPAAQSDSANAVDSSATVTNESPAQVPSPHGLEASK
ncbi:MAG: ATP-binding protein [Antricoccus sp.]